MLRNKHKLEGVFPSRNERRGSKEGRSAKCASGLVDTLPAILVLVHNYDACVPAPSRSYML
jgi:hypothetical protein